MIIVFFQAEDGIRDPLVTGVQTCALPISSGPWVRARWHVVRRGELPSVRVARPAHRNRMGTPRRSRFARGPATRGSPARRTAGAVVDRSSRLHISGAQGFAVWRLAGAAGISRALGGWLGAFRDERHRPVARSALHSAAVP